MKKIIASLCALALAVAPAFAQTFTKDLEKKAKGGDAAAMIEVGDCFFNGSGTKKDPKKAKDWYEKAAQAGNIDAYSRLVNCYSSWDGIEKNPQKAFEWIRKGAEAGDPQLKLVLANAYMNGDGVPRDVRAAVGAYIEAAYEGIEDAYKPALEGSIVFDGYIHAFSLGYMLDRKDGVSPEIKNLARNAMGLVFLRSGLWSAADECFAGADMPELALYKFRAKTMSGNSIDFQELEKAVAGMPDDDAYANFYRGMVALKYGNFNRASELFVKSTQGGNILGAMATLLCAMSDNYMLYYVSKPKKSFDDDILINYAIDQLKQTQRDVDESLIIGAGLKDMIGPDFSPRYHKANYNQRLLAVFNDLVKQMPDASSNFTDVNSFLGAYCELQYVSNESDNKQFQTMSDAMRYVVDNYLPTNPKNLDAIYQTFSGRDNDFVAGMFNKAATVYPQYLLEWAEKNQFQPDILAPGLSLPELLETAAKNATGETREKLVKALDSRYGRSI